MYPPASHYHWASGVLLGLATRVSCDPARTELLRLAGLVRAELWDVALRCLEARPNGRDGCAQERAMDLGGVCFNRDPLAQRIDWSISLGAPRGSLGSRLVYFPLINIHLVVGAGGRPRASGPGPAGWFGCGCVSQVDVARFQRFCWTHLGSWRTQHRFFKEGHQTGLEAEMISKPLRIDLLPLRTDQLEWP